MAIPGERFVLDWSDDEDVSASQPTAANLTNLIGEIKERTPQAPTAPTAPKLRSSTGFPTPKNRLAGSAFKQQRRGNASTVPPRTSAYASQPPNRISKPDLTSPSAQPESIEDEEKRIIDEENKQRIAAMTESEIESEKAELMAHLSPSLIEKLLRRANLDDDVTAPSPYVDKTGPAEDEYNHIEPPKKAGKSVTFAAQVSDKTQSSKPVDNSRDTGSRSVKTTNTTTDVEDQAPAVHPPDLRPASEIPSGPIHFPTPPPRQNPMPNLDPTSPSFYDDLQAHYFPDTPHDSAALSWLKPRKEGEGGEGNGNDRTALSAYNPSSSTTEIVPSALRFSFRGEILPPSKALELPTSLGLHHHADDPEAAGYTISELSILSRSTLPAQRCVAWQILGRILLRLGSGEFGPPESDLVEGLWKVIELENVVSRMLEEAEGGVTQERSYPGEGQEEADTGPKSNIGKHASAKAWAVEGIWLWQKGGGRRGIANPESR